VNKVDIKIVGSISDEDELDEIQSIAKIFVYEQRMKCFKHPVKDNSLIRKNYLKYHKKTDDHRKINYNHLSHLMVRGLA